LTVCSTGSEYRLVRAFVFVALIVGLVFGVLFLVGHGSVDRGLHRACPGCFEPTTKVSPGD
jgi:hypothetical protein